MEVTAPEVTAMHQKVRFFKDDGKDLAEISWVGSKDNIIKKVTPDIMARYRDEWNAYCDGTPLKVRDGTKLDEVPGMHTNVAENFIAQNVHTAEELAALSDAQCQALGHGTLTMRGAARTLLEMRKAKLTEEMSKRISQASVAGTLSDAQAQAEMDAKYATKADVDDIKSMLAQLMAQSTRRGPGRPRKEG
jgi:hypothetical protein